MTARGGILNRALIHHSRREENAQMHMNILALGPELRALAREFTDDLNEACFMVHHVVSRLLQNPDPETPVDIDRARALLRQTARELRSGNWVTA
jgi:hypothetical protein